MNDITTVIVTRNRAKDLGECLQSLAEQVEKPEKVIVISTSVDNTSSVIKSFEKKLNITEIEEKRKGYPYARNRAFKEVRTKWLSFIDDDCLANKNWHNKIVSTINSFKNGNNLAAILGKSNNYYGKNIFACAFKYGNELWREEYMDSNGNITSYEILETRNIIYNVKLLKSRKIKYDTRLIYGSEDSDLGMQIQKHKLRAVYEPNILVNHKYPKTFSEFRYKKRLYRKSSHLFKSLKQYKKTQKNEVSFQKKFQIFNQVAKQLTRPQKLISAALVKL